MLFQMVLDGEQHVTLQHMYFIKKVFHASYFLKLFFKRRTLQSH